MATICQINAHAPRVRLGVDNVETQAIYKFLIFLISSVRENIDLVLVSYGVLLNVNL